MHTLRLATMTVLLSLVTGCQMFTHAPAPPSTANVVRLQGTLTQQDQTWWFTPCDSQERLKVTEQAGSSILQEAKMLQAGGGPLFADIGAARRPGELLLNRFYRLQYEGNACGDPIFRRLQARAAGNEPFWSSEVSPKGMVIDRPGEQQSMVLPFLEERLPDGSMSLTSEANGHRVELWLAPQRCTDSMSGNLYHLTAELRVDGKVDRGCAYYGGQRQ